MEELKPLLTKSGVGHRLKSCRLFFSHLVYTRHSKTTLYTQVSLEIPLIFGLMGGCSIVSWVFEAGERGSLGRRLKKH